VKEEIRRRQEIQKLTNQLKKANVRLQELDRMKSEFLSVASHELNSPMSIIKGYLHMILWEGFGKVDKNARTYLEKVYMKTDQLAKLVADLLNVSRIEQGRIQLDIKPVDIQPILKDICEDHAIKAKEKGLTFTYHESKQPLPNVLSDADKFKEILQNLLSNAIKFTKTGGVEVSVGQKDGFVKVSVKDTGVGIPKEAQEHIFEKFYRVDNSWVREVGGTGLGLYIVREYLKLMNGKIWFESEGEDKGTTFYFALPIAEPGDTHHEIKELTIEGKERPEYTKSPQDEIKESLERIKNHNHNNHEQEKKSLKDQLLANKEEREKMKEKILKEAEEFRKQQKTQKDL
jgi:signal transduction histidine kinase